MWREEIDDNDMQQKTVAGIEDNAVMWYAS